MILRIGRIITSSSSDSLRSYKGLIIKVTKEWNRILPYASLHNLTSRQREHLKEGLPLEINLIDLILKAVPLREILETLVSLASSLISHLMRRDHLNAHKHQLKSLSIKPLIEEVHKGEAVTHLSILRDQY
jgi:hypothetical protein